MRKFIFSLKTLVMSLALVVGGSAWAQITGLPFVADFSSGEIAPFTGAAVVKTFAGSEKAIVANAGEAYAQFDAPYVISNMDEVTVSFQMLNGWLASGAGNKFALLNDEGVALASISYDNKSCNINEVVIGGTAVEGFEAFNGQSMQASGKGADGFDKNFFILNTAEAKYNAEVTIKINAFGGISISFVGGKNNNDKFWSGTAGTAKLNLDKMFITNASNNDNRATGYYGLTITNKSMLRYANDYSDGVVTWTTATNGRYTPIIEDDYLTVDQGSRNNNGTTITSTETEGKVAAGESFTMSFDVKLGASTNQTATAFNIYDAANSAAILSFAEGATFATAWTINGGTQTATVSAGGNKAIDELAWIDVKVTSIAGGKTYLTLKDADGNIIDGFDKKDIPTLSTEGGLGKMNFVTSRYLANFAIDNIVVRDVVESEDIPATPIYTYTVKFVDQEGAEFKDPSVREEYEGVELAITDDDKATVIDGSIKYTYVSDDAAGQTAASDGSTVITVTFSKTIVTDYTVNFLDTSNGEIKAAVVHKNVLVGTEVSATQGELSKILKEGVFFEYASGNEPITLVEDAASNVINLYFAPVEGVTGYFYNNYEDKTVDWTTATGGRYDPIAVDGSKIADRGTTERKPKVDPETGEPIYNPETGEPEYEEVPGLSIPFGNKTYFLSVNQANRNNNGVTNGVSSASLAVEQADFTLETKIILGTSNNQGCSFQIKNFANDANILQLIPTAVGSTTWVVNGDAENFAVELPGTGNFGGTDNNNLTNYDWYDLKVTVYNGTTFVTIVDQNDNVILDKAQVPTLATTYGVSKMIFYTGRYNSNIAVDDVTVRSVVVDEDVPAGTEFVAVKINYVDEAGTPVKESAEVNFQVGQPIVLNEALVADFKVTESGEVWVPGSEAAPVTKYIYVSDNSDEVEAALGAQVNIVFRGVASRRVALRYQIQKADGTITAKDDAGKNFPFFYDSNKAGDVLFEGDELTFYYPFYFLADGLLYKTANNSDGSAKDVLVVEPGTSTQVKSPITWTPATETVQVVDEDGNPLVDPETEQPVTRDDQISNAIFAQETENIEGITVVKDGYTQIRQANGAAGSAIGGNVLIANLEPGTYTITSATRSGLTNFLAGDEFVFSVESSGTVVTSTSGEFTVDVATPLYIEEQSATTKYSDYVLVRQLSSIASYPITVADGIENGTVEAPAAAAADATVKVNVTPDNGYELASLTITCVESENEINYDINDYSFTMPTEPVFITATFTQKKIYIETDLTAQFPIDWQGWNGATGYVGWAAPQVTTNDGRTTAACERYNNDCSLIGDVFTRTLSGLTNGTYRIELYGAAANTPGRGCDSGVEEGDLTSVYLYAQTAEGEVKQYIPAHVVDNFNSTGIATAVLDGVEVTDGTVKLGMFKDKAMTNWHVVQLKGVTAKVLASDLLETAVVAAGMVEEDDVPEALYREIQETIATYDKAYDTAEEYLTAIAALEAVVAKAEAYAPLAEALGEGEEIKANIAEGNPQIATYDEAIADVKEAYDAVAVADIPAAIAVVQAAITPEFVKAQTAPGSDMTRAVPNAAGNEAVGEDNWKLENALADGEKFQLDTWAGTASGMAVPMIEFWHAPGTALVSNTIYQTIEGLNPGIYRVTATTAVNNEQTVALNEGSALLFANEGTTDITTGGETTSFSGTTGTFTVEGVVGSDGKLTLGFKAVEPNYNWLAFKDVELTFQNVAYPISYADGMVNGTVEGPAFAAEGDEVALTVTPAEGYELASIAVTNEAGEELEVEYDAWDGIATFEMPAEAVFVAATFQEAYVKVSEFAIASDGFIEPDGSTKVTGTYTFETAGSYSEMFFGEVVYDVKITAEGLEEPIEATLTCDELDGDVAGYVSGLENGKEYTANLVGVHVWDYISFTEIFTKVAELGGVLATTNFTAVKVYPISYADGMVNGTVEGPAYAAEGDEVELTVTPAEGCELASIAVTNEAGEEIEVDYDAWEGTATFEMPAEAVFVAATFQEAYVKVSDFAIASTGILDEDGDVEITGTYEFETAGSYSEVFFGEVVYDVQITAEGLEAPIEATLTGDVLDGEVDSYVEGLVAGTEYTANLVGVHVWDYNTFTEIFTKVAELGGVLATTTFTAINQPVIEPLLVDINVDRYVGYGYTPTVAEVDFTEALEFLGVDEITTDMLSFVNPDLTTISYADYMAANYDGWCDGEGKATNWGENTKICVKFFQALEDGEYQICDMNGADEVGATYTVRWVANNGNKVVVFTTNVTFVEEPVTDYTFEDLNVIETQTIELESELGECYEGLTSDVDVEGILTKLGENGLDNVSIFAVQSDGTLDSNYKLGTTDGWRNADGDWQGWGDNAYFYVKANFAAADTQIYEVGGMQDKNTTADWESPATYTATYAFVKPGANLDAVVLEVKLIYNVPTGFAELKAADGVKPNGKYLEKGKVVIWQNGTKFSTSGTIAR